MARTHRRPPRRLAPAIAFLLAAPATLAAQNEGNTLRTGPEQPVTRVGTRGANFLELGVGARANALAGAGTVTTDGVAALYWNPAATAATQAFAVGVHYSELYEDSGIEHYFTGALLPVAGGVIGVSVNSLTSGDIPRTVEETPSGENVGVGTTFSWTSTAIGAHYSRLITDRFAVGAGLKWISEGIESASARWFGADIGLRFHTGLYGIVLGAMIGNIGGSARMEGPLVRVNQTAALEAFETGRTISVDLATGKNPLPTYFRLGLALDLLGSAQALLGPDPRHRLSAMFDLRDAVDTDIQPTVALEYAFRERIFLRGGKQWFNEAFGNYDLDDGLSAGFGVRVPVMGRHVAFDYAYTSLGVLQSKQVLSFEFGW